MTEAGNLKMCSLNQEKELIEKRLKYLKKDIERIKEEKNDKINKNEDL